MQFDGEKIVDVVEAAYRSSDEREWVRGVLETMVSLCQVTSAGFFRFAANYREGSFHVTPRGQLIAVGPDIVTSDTALGFLTNIPFAEVSYGRTIGSTISQLSGIGSVISAQRFFRARWREPVVDVLGLVSRDAGNDGTAIVVGLHQLGSLSKRQQRLLTRVATHVGAANRLPAQRSADDADAVLSPNGKLLHVTEPARISEVRDGVARRAFARKSRHDAEQALAAWQGLVDGTWSIVDHFDTDGKRFVLAMKNAPEVAPRAQLAPQDRRVAALAAMGHRDKEIAYSLGITMGSVAAALRRARKAFGVKTRAELAAAWRRSAE